MAHPQSRTLPWEAPPHMSAVCQGADEEGGAGIRAIPVPRAGQTAPEATLAAGPSLGEWKTLYFLHLSGKVMKQWWLAVPGNYPGTWYPENLPGFSDRKAPTLGKWSVLRDRCMLINVTWAWDGRAQATPSVGRGRKGWRQEGIPF